MVGRKAMVSACGVAMLASFTLAAASARTSDPRTYFTFSEPVELPDVVLPAGTYLFRIAETTGSHSVVQVLSDDGKTTHGMFHTIPAQRLESAEEAEIRFWETPSTMPPAIKTWWYPGTPVGREFIYPEDRHPGSRDR